jgi:hypothetical protein
VASDLALDDAGSGHKFDEPTVISLFVRLAGERRQQLMREAEVVAMQTTSARSGP